ncbi:hypothetical protein [Moorena sp. SIO4G3]|uniref:hypothetical protein n=1 Tax=Moorena sp. SIO4G3 TaxID=2607821 RepID=UPI00142AA984|nr:hypothetical protein [Moorena sp. SIO4G3]NEO80846.1 hypothetical protein [Moorena sp. SIO4G3]
MSQLASPANLEGAASRQEFLALGATAIANSVINVRTPLLPRRGFQTSDYFL